MSFPVSHSATNTHAVASHYIMRWQGRSPSYVACRLSLLTAGRSQLLSIIVADAMQHALELFIGNRPARNNIFYDRFIFRMK